MLSESIEVKESKHITFNTNITNLNTLVRDFELLNIAGSTIEININSINEEEFYLFSDLDLTIFNDIHITLNFPLNIMKRINMEVIIKNFLIKNIKIEGGNYQVKLYKAKSINSRIEANNYKVCKKAMSFNFNDWSPTSNILNESLKLSNNLLNELNHTLLEKKKLNKDMRTIKEIVNEL